jgi:hypothetical protein
MYNTINVNPFYAGSEDAFEFVYLTSVPNGSDSTVLLATNAVSINTPLNGTNRLESLL